MIPGLLIIQKEIHDQITDQLDKVGILYRIFSRVKNISSIEEKVRRKESDDQPYSEENKLMQDLLGFRIITYFKDDIDIVYTILRRILKYHDEEIDEIKLTVFEPKRTNIICKLNVEQSQILNDIKSETKSKFYKIIDNTFELQLRTILSEGWHEIDHSLRYKCKSDWKDYIENERMLNGIYASLETNDIVLKNLFNELAYKHYKAKNWEGLLRNKFRLKFQQESLNEDLLKLLDNNAQIGKQILRLSRSDVIQNISKMEISIPLSFNNLIYLTNLFFINNEQIKAITPKLILEEY